MIPGNINTDLISGAEGAYQVERSLRLNPSDSAFLSRTPASAGNRKTWTWSGWVKRSGLGTYQRVFNARNPGVAADYIRFNNDNTLELYFGATLITAQVFRDVSSWYHLTVAVDTTQATSSNRVKLYVNGTQVTTFATTNYPSQNADTLFNATLIHNIGTGDGTTEYFSGYLADIHFIDGQALTPSSFAETNATTGQWVPKAYGGSYGTNGFRLDFSDNSAATATTLGKDRAGSNNWTPNNLSVTAGAGNDSLVDTPTSYGTDTGAGGEVRGNYCTWSPIDNVSSSTLANGNLDINNTGDGANRIGTMGVSSGKWYYEFVQTVNATAQTGINSERETGSSTPNRRMYYVNGQKYNGSTGSAYGATWTTGDVIGIALDLDAGTLVFYKNGVSQGTAFTGLTGTWYPWVRVDTSGSVCVANFGQRPFAYPVSGYKAWCDTNLPAPTIARPSTVMDVKLYTGNGSTQTISGLGFSPDLVWVKQRTSGASHVLVDTVRGAFKLSPNQTIAEVAGGAFYGSVSPTSDGFSLVQGSDTDPSYGGFWEVGANAKAYASWAWDAGSSTVTNTQGSITSQVRANASAGFSVVTWTAPSSGSGWTVGHGLGAAPFLMIDKCRSNTGNWTVYHQTQGATKALYLNTTDSVQTSSMYWNDTAPSSTVFTCGTTGWYGAGFTHVTYCFAPVAGYSAFGSYTGNGSADGPFVFTGFRPRWVLIKGSSFATTGWAIYDAVRNTFNVANNLLTAESSSAETNYPEIDLLSNGFKLRGTNPTWNYSGQTHIYAAFAENPFQYARAR